MFFSYQLIDKFLWILFVCLELRPILLLSLVVGLWIFFGFTVVYIDTFFVTKGSQTQVYCAQVKITRFACGPYFRWSLTKKP